MREGFWIELQRHLVTGEEPLLAALVELAAALGLGLVATNDVRHASPADRRLLGSANDVVDIRTQPASAPTWAATIAVDLLYYRLSAVLVLAPGSRP